MYDGSWRQWLNDRYTAYDVVKMVVEKETGCIVEKVMGWKCDGDCEKCVVKLDEKR